MKSKESPNFRITLLDRISKTEIPSLETLGSKYFVGTEDQEFLIKIYCDDSNSVYGATLFIEGQLVMRNKTFKSAGTFFGFKQGNGNYISFKFTKPIENEICISNPEISVTFHPTIETESWLRQHLSRSNANARRNELEFKSNSMVGGKKGIAQSLTISKGTSFHNSMKSARFNRRAIKNVKAADENPSKLNWKIGNSESANSEFDFVCNEFPADNIVINDKVIEGIIFSKISIKYGSYGQLLIRDVINFGKEEHLRFIPKETLRTDVWSFIMCITAILNSEIRVKGKGSCLSEEQLLERFTAATGLGFLQLPITVSFDCFMSVHRARFERDSNCHYTLRDRSEAMKEYRDVVKNFSRSGVLEMRNRSSKEDPILID